MLRRSGHRFRAVPVEEAEGSDQLTSGHEQRRRWDDLPMLMDVGRHYPNAPIVEAIIEIRCELPTDVTLERLLTAVDADEFPTTDGMFEVTGFVSVDQEGVSGSTQGRQIGHTFRSADGRHVVQSRRNGFAFAALAPYADWETFSATAERCWARYREVASPTRATRLGVRFVNKIVAPSRHIEIKDYLRTAIDVSPYLPQMVNGYFLQVIIPLGQFNATATVTSTIQSADDESTSLILDIDTWQDVSLDLIPGKTSGDIEERLNTLRRAKNHVFEACITDATRGLIK